MIGPQKDQEMAAHGGGFKEEEANKGRAWVHMTTA